MKGSSFGATLRIIASSAATSALRGSSSWAIYSAGVSALSWPFMTSQAITRGHHFEIHPLRHRRFLLAGVFIGHHDLHQVLARAQLAAERKHSAAHQARGIGRALRERVAVRAGVKQLAVAEHTQLR